MHSVKFITKPLTNLMESTGIYLIISVNKILMHKIHQKLISKTIYYVILIMTQTNLRKLKDKKDAVREIINGSSLFVCLLGV